MTKLSPREMASLAMADANGFIMVTGSGFGRSGSRKRLEKLCSLGLLEDTGFGDWRITDAGRTAVKAT